MAVLVWADGSDHSSEVTGGLELVTTKLEEAVRSRAAVTFASPGGGSVVVDGADFDQVRTTVDEIPGSYPVGPDEVRLTGGERIVCVAETHEVGQPAGIHR